MITVMTPTYNRAYILEKAYQSLKKQTSFDFEWIIIDDGSLDDTEHMVRQWITECTAFDITYFKQPNGGKHRAINRAVKMARYDWFFILDSDDQLMDTAVETVHRFIAEVSGLPGFAGVAGLRGNANQAIGGQPKQRFMDATNLQRKKFGLLGDKAEIYKTEVLKRYPFPEFEGENFIRESAVWDRIAQDGLKLRWYNEIIYLCEYIADGLTQNTNTETYQKNFEGYTYCVKLFLKTHTGLPFLHKCGEFYQVARLKNISFKKAAERLQVNCLLFSIGIAVFKMKTPMKAVIRAIRSFWS